MDQGHDTSASFQLLFLLRQQRYLYHQLKLLTDRQKHLSGTDSPEQMLEIINGRRKLIEKLRQLDARFRPIKSNWENLSRQIGPEDRKKARELVREVRDLISNISESCPVESSGQFSSNEMCELNEILSEEQF